MNIADIMSRRLWTMYVLPWVAFTIVAYMTRDPALILVGNIVRTSVALSVFITFTPENWRIAKSTGPLTRGMVIAYGIWWGWGSVAAQGMLTFVWRAIGQPLWLVNTDITSAIIFAACIGGTAHMWRPGEIDGHIPLRKNIRIAIIIGAATAIGLTLLQLPEIHAAWLGKRVSWVVEPYERAVAGPPQTLDEDTAVRTLHRLVSPEALPGVTPERGPDQPLRNVVRLYPVVTEATAEKIEQSRVSHGDRSTAAAARRLIDSALGDEDRDVLGPYDSKRR